ncbi:MAG: cation:proton antiporter [Bdellovibrionota bacterium]|nr:hypothetical protein [Pseudobdellovibrionaceae bacterium]
MTTDLQYFILIAAILLLPKILMRYGVPSGITAIVLGVATGFGLDWFEGSQTLYILSTLGITSLFLFAGMEVEVAVLKKNYKFLLKSIGLSLFLIMLTTVAIDYYFRLGTKASLILALGLTTPSTGFILNSVHGYELTDEVKTWIRNKSIAAEIVAILILFFTLQSESIGKLLLSLAVIVGMILILPYFFKLFLKKIAPFAPDSEMTFLVLIAFLCGIITREIGTYYLVGAFIVGMVASQFHHFDEDEKTGRLLYSLQLFFAFFVPFYFFRAGLTISDMTFDWAGALFGLGFLLIFIPLRYFTTFLPMRYLLNIGDDEHRKVSISLLPTLIFGVVIALILKDEGVRNDAIVGLIIYTVVSSIIPAILLKRTPPKNYDDTSLFG